MIVLVLNVGSSSVKFAGFATSGPGRDLNLLVRQVAPRASGLAAGDEVSDADLAHVRHAIEQVEAASGGRPIDVVGHRIVHGGRVFAGPTRLDAAALEGVRALSRLAPLHQPHNIMGVLAVERLRPGAPQIACFDTAFHRTQPEVRRRLPIPDAYFDAGIERYGFHGLSYAWLVRALARQRGGLPARLLAFHLGSGASACAILDGRSQATSMGFSTLDGLMMGTRPGSLDPGVILHLLGQGMDQAALSELLYTRSGLLGVSGLTNDMKQLLATDTPPARRAVEMFCNSAAAVGAGLATSLGGLDAIVFTGGVGENAAAVRAGIVERLALLGVALDADANAAHGPLISSSQSKVETWVLPADEERLIAEEVMTIAI